MRRRKKRREVVRLREEKELGMKYVEASLQLEQNKSQPL